MSFDSLLIDTCTIQEFTEASTDAYGQPVKTWSNLYEDEPCRHLSGKGREVKIGQEAVIIYDEMFVNDIVVNEQDRVIIDGLTYEIISVVFRQDGISTHHKHCYLEIVK